MDESSGEARPPRRPALLCAGLAAALAGLALSFGPARLTMLNSALRLDHPPAQALALLCATAGLGLVVAAVRGRARLVAAALSAVSLLATADRALYRVDLDERSVRVRKGLWTTSVAWGDVRAVRPSPAALVLETAEGPLRIDTSELRLEHLRVLERAVARRVEAAGAPPEGSPPAGSGLR